MSELHILMMMVGVLWATVVSGGLWMITILRDIRNDLRDIHADLREINKRLDSLESGVIAKR